MGPDDPYDHYYHYTATSLNSATGKEPTYRALPPDKQVDKQVRLLEARISDLEELVERLMLIMGERAGAAEVLDARVTEVEQYIADLES